MNKNSDSVVTSTREKCKCIKCYVSRNGVDSVIDRVKNNSTIDSNNCWIWKLSTNPQGYPLHSVGRKLHTVQRSMWIIMSREPVIGPRDVVFQKCNNKMCCNPEHSETTTRSEYTARFLKHKRKISESVVRKIRMLRRNGYSYKRLQKIFEMDPRHISHIANYKIYKDITE